MPTRTIAVWIAAFALVFAVGNDDAAAQKTEAEKKAAKHYKQGRAYYDADVHDKALEEFQAAYDLAPKPLLLYHLARAQVGLAHDDEALALFQRFVDEEPDQDSDAVVDARVQIATLTKRIAARAPPPEPIRLPPPEVAPDPAPDVVVAQPLPGPSEPPSEPPVARKGRHRTLWMIAAGALALALGGALDALPASSSNGSLDAVDFAPAGLYAVGLTGIVVGMLR